MTESAEVTHTAGRISKGAAAPSEARTAATVVGSSWMEAVFMTIRRHISSVAVRVWASSCIRFTAAMPMGVAALPRPSRLAETLAHR